MEGQTDMIKLTHFCTLRCESMKALSYVLVDTVFFNE